MENAREIAVELLNIESRSKGELLQRAAAVIMGQAHIIIKQKKAYDKLMAEVERCWKAMPVGHPRTDYESISRAADFLSGYCATHTCEVCPLSPACQAMGMGIHKMLSCVAEVVEKPRMAEEFASKR